MGPRPAPSLRTLNPKCRQLKPNWPHGGQGPPGAALPRSTPQSSSARQQFLSACRHLRRLKDAASTGAAQGPASIIHWLSLDTRKHT